MTVVNSPRQTRNARSEVIAEIADKNDVGNTSTASRHSMSRPQNSSARSVPTEYHQSYRKRTGARPRNPVGGWQARNISNILPTGPERPPQPNRASRRPPPEALRVRQATTQVFPVAPPQPPQNEPGAVDINNNPPAPPPLVPGNRRRTGHWPWQTRARTSTIFEPENLPAPSPPRRFSQQRRVQTNKYPWQDRAQKSVIFDLLSGQDTIPKPKSRRKYDWDQQQSKLVTEAVQWQGEQATTSAKANDTDKPNKEQDNQAAKKSKWPWQERAKQSVVFAPPDKPSCPRPVNYLWDQRRSRIQVLLDPTAQFSKGSSYKDNFIQWGNEPKNKGIVKAAGKPCYKDEDEGDKKKKEEKRISSEGGKRMFKSQFTPAEIIPAPEIPSKVPENSDCTKEEPSKKSVSKTSISSKASVAGSIKGSTCLELVPADYKFSKTDQRENNPKN